MAKAALCVGINDYPGIAADLSGCVNDADDWAAELDRRGYAITRLHDHQASGGAIRVALERLIGSATAGDSLAFTFSGHGSWISDDDGDEDDSRDEVLVPHDVSSGAVIVDDELAEIFGRKPPGSQLFFIADACHSGTVARFGPSLSGGAGQVVRPRFLPPASFGRKTPRAFAARPLPRAKYAALLVAACGDAEFAYDAWFDGRPNGAFTRVALDALRIDPATPSAWMIAIRERLPTAEFPQTPRLFGSRAARHGAMP